MAKRVAITEYVLRDVTVSDLNLAKGTRIFWAPRSNGNGALYEIARKDVKVGDTIVILNIEDRAQGGVLHLLQFGHVTRVDDESFGMEMNPILGAGGDSGRVYDRVAGLLGLPFGEP
jgi:hypothetical protein